MRSCPTATRVPQVPVVTPLEALNVLKRGLQNRTVAETGREGATGTLEFCLCFRGLPWRVA